MGKYTDEDGVDGPFLRALRAAERDDAKARLKRMVREGASFAVHEPAGAEVAEAIRDWAAREEDCAVCGKQECNLTMRGADWYCDDCRRELDERAAG